MHSEEHEAHPAKAFERRDMMDKLVALCKRRGFIFPSSEIYGGINSCWDYGPLGVELKNNIKAWWWRSMTWHRDDIEGLDAAILMHPRVWEASATSPGSAIRWWIVNSASRGFAPIRWERRAVHASRASPLARRDVQES